MGMKNYYLSLFVFMYWINVQSQSNDDLNKNEKTVDIRKSSELVEEIILSNDYEQAYEKLKKLYTRKQSSQSNILLSAFIDKMNINDMREFYDVQAQGNILEWISDNINSTSFANIEEATKEYKLYLEEVTTEGEEDGEFYSYLRLVVKKFGGGIFADVVYDYEMNNPDSILNKKLRESNIEKQEP